MLQQSRRYVRRAMLALPFIVLFFSVAQAQTEVAEPDSGIVAPRRLHPRWKPQSSRHEARHSAIEAVPEAAPFEGGKSAAADNLVIVKGFAGLAFPNSFGSVPPDTILAAGPAHIVEVINTAIAVFDRFTGKRLLLQDLTLFFAPVGAGNFLFDPQVSYDELAERFVIAALDVDDLQERGFLLYAVSNSADPTAGFSEMHRIEVTQTGLNDPGTVLPDFPRMGWNADAHVISLNMFTAESEDFDHVTMITIDKSTVLDANPASFSLIRNNLGNDNFTMVPAIMHDSAPGDPMWLVEESSDAFQQKIRLVQMTNLLSAPSFVNFDLDVTPYEFPPNAPQPGSGAFPGDCFSSTGAGFICTNDSSMLSAAWRANRLVATHTIGLASTSQSHVRWYEFDTTGSPALAQEGTLDPGAGIYTYFPSIELARNGDIGMTFMQSSASQFMSMYVTGQSGSDPAGQVRAPVAAKAGQGTYRAFDCFSRGAFVSDCRAGDFSGISLDPNFSNMFCAANEYATASGGKNGVNNWGTWISCFAIGIHDLAVTSVIAPAAVIGPGPVTGAVKVAIQNRGDHAETITAADLGDGFSTGLVRLNVSVLDDNEGCLAPGAAGIALDSAKNAGLFSGGARLLAAKKMITVNFLVTFNCPGALAKNSADSTAADYAFSATVHHDVLDGEPDIHDEDDVCPRDALPGRVDPLPPPRGFADKGCGGKKPDRTLGAPVTTQVYR